MADTLTGPLSPAKTDAPAGHFDVAIIGSGIAGSMLACILAKAGQKVVLYDAGTHPKFAIGESMILETSEIMRSLALLFDVPELEYFSAENFLPLIGPSHGVKRHFGFLSQRPGKPHDPADTVQAVIPKAPYGHELHIYRQDSDAFYCAAAVRYGATVFQTTPVTGVETDAGGVAVQAPNGRSARASFVVDAGGMRSVLAEAMGVRRRNLQAQSRALFTHMTGVEPLKAARAGGPAGLPFSMAEGTLHHVFEGGWMWVIPFDNHPDAINDLCSVGLMLDPRIHPPREDLSPEEEFRAFIAKYPDMAEQFAEARAVREWVRAPRIQYSATAAAGERSFILGHAAGFIDPLFSKGLYTSLASILGVGKALIAAKEDGDYSPERFRGAEATTLRYIAANDRLVANAYKSFAAPRLWRRYSALWILGAYLELVRLTTYRIELIDRAATPEARRAIETPELGLVGGGYAPFKALADQVDAIVERTEIDNPAAIDAAIAEIDALYRAADWMPGSHKALAFGATHLPRRKFTPNLLLRKGGLMGRPDYRDHFFRGVSAPRLAWFMLSEQVRYSRAAMARRKRRAFRGAV